MLGTNYRAQSPGISFALITAIMAKEPPGVLVQEPQAFPHYYPNKMVNCFPPEKGVFLPSCDGFADLEASNWQCVFWNISIVLCLISTYNIQ